MITEEPFETTREDELTDAAAHPGDARAHDEAGAAVPDPPDPRAWAADFPTSADAADEGYEAADDYEAGDGEEYDEPDAPHGRDGVEFETHVSETTDVTIQNVAGDVEDARKYFQAVINMLPQPEAAQQEEVALVDLTTALPLRPPRVSFNKEEFGANLDRLKEGRLLLVSCPDDDIAFDAAYALVGGLNLPRPEQYRALDFGRAAREGTTPNLFYLRGKQGVESEVAVVVNAVGELSREFLDSLISANRMSSETLQDDLRRNRIYLLCLVDASLAQERFKSAVANGELRFAHWRVPFLGPLLAARFPEDHDEIEAKVIRQRALGRWSEDDYGFYSQLTSDFRNGTLLDRIEANESDKPAPRAASLALFESTGQLRRIVLYAAAFFPNLSPHEFRQFVHLLLEEHARSVPPAGAEASADRRGFVRPWAESPDDVLRECGLATLRLESQTKVVSFDNFRQLEELRNYLESEYSLFLEQQFEGVQRLGLLFGPSARVAENVMRLILRMASDYPEDYGPLWLADLVRTSHRAAEDSRHNARRPIYQRTAELTRRMLEAPGISETVAAFAQQLLITKNFKLLFEIVKRLQLAPNFDEFRWLRQLLDRGDDETRQQIYSYLFGYLKKVRGRVYQIMRVLESWLPEPGRAARNNSASSRTALRLVLAYCLGATSKFDKELYGCWPSQFPLFNFRDAATARESLRLLTRCLFHPGVRAAVRGRGITRDSINALTVRWIFILLDRDDEAQGCGATEEVDVGPVEVRDILLAEIARNAAPEQQAALLEYWEHSTRLLLDQIIETPPGPSQWRLSRRRGLLSDAASAFRQVQAELAALPASEGAARERGMR